MIRIPLHGAARRALYVAKAVEAIKRFFTLAQADTFEIEARYLSLAQIKTKAYDEYRIVFYDDIEKHRKEAYKKIDDAANAADYRLQNMGGSTYISKLRECDKWDAAGRPANINTGQWGFLRAERKRLEVIYGQTPTALQAYNSIQNFAEKWEQNSEARELYRGVGKAYVEVAETVAQIDSAVAIALDKLSKL